MQLTALTAVSPLDGRYSSNVENLRELFSEYALIAHRVFVEIRWLQHLAAHPGIEELSALSADENEHLETIISQFTLEDAIAVKHIEATTNHDVKAVEYFIKERCQAHRGLAKHMEFIHFACTSADINNLAYALMLMKCRDALLIPSIDATIQQFVSMATEYAATPMLSLTHGQSATPTTMGKEIANITARLQRQRDQLARVAISGKMNGAVGNFNAHCVSYPNVDWLALSENFVQQLGLTWQPYTTQIEPHDFVAELCHANMRFNTICIDASRDFWAYISRGYFTQRLKEGEVGSSTMPHKVNPIDFENAEGNLGIANALFQHFAEKLPISRLQRDLSDSTVMRNVGVAFGHTLLAFQSLQRGLKKCLLNETRLIEDLNNNWEVLAEPIQTVMRRYGVEQAYEQLKSFTRGKSCDAQSMHDFIRTLDLPADALAQLMQLTPSGYTGLAEKLASEIGDNIKAS